MLSIKFTQFLLFWAYDRTALPRQLCESRWLFLAVSVSGNHVCHFQMKAFNSNVRPSRTASFPLPWLSALVYSKENSWVKRSIVLWICPTRSWITEPRQSKSRVLRHLLGTWVLWENEIAIFDMEHNNSVHPYLTRNNNRIAAFL